MSYEAWVERWQERKLNDHLLGIYGSESEEDCEEFDEIDPWPETDRS